MAVTLPRENWTDKRLDDLNQKVDEGFARADKKMDDGFARVDSDIRELRGEVRSLNRTVYGGVVVIVAAMIGNNALF